MLTCLAVVRLKSGLMPETVQGRATDSHGTRCIQRGKIGDRLDAKVIEALNLFA